MDPISAALIFGKVKGFFGKLFTNKWLWIALLGAVAAYTGYRVFHNYVDNKVETAVVDDRKDATIQTYQAKEKVDEGVADIDRKHDVIREQTIKEYHYVRDQIKAAPAEQREAPSPDLIIDTLNALGGMRRGQAGPDALLETAGPVG